MESIKCHQCGLVSWPDKGVVSCQRCGSPIWQRNDYGAGFTFKKSEDMSLFSGVIVVLTIAFGVAMLALILSKVFQLGETQAVTVIGVLIALLGLFTSIAMGIWFLARVFGESVGWGLAAIFLPFGGLIALIMFWDRTHRPFFANLICNGILLAGFFTIT
jgi:hypothetical protein